MKIINLKVESLKPYKLNSKLHPQSQIEGIAESIRRFGFTQPVVIDKENEIIIGHGRVAAAKLAGLKDVPCIRREDLSKEQIRALRLIDNRIAEYGWDQEILKIDLQGFDFDFEPFNVDFSGFLSEPDFKPSDEGDKSLDELDPAEPRAKIACPNCGHEF